MSTPRRILVTGGAGFVGSHVVDRLIAGGREVRVLDWLHPLAHARPPEYLNPEADYVWGDVRDPETVAAAVVGVDAVSHQAAMVGLGIGLDDLVEYADHNTLGTAVLLRELHRAGFEGRLVLGGSMVVYGEGRYRCLEHGRVAAPPRAREDLARGRFEPRCPNCGLSLRAEAIPESAGTDPRNVYAATKLNQEHLCAAFAREAGASLIALRYHNVYGPRMPGHTPYAGVASVFRSALTAGRAPLVFEDGGQLRDFVHVTDIARANVLALDAPPQVAGPFNIASGKPRSVGDFAAELAHATGGPSPRVTGNFRLGDVRHVFASIGRARAELGFQPRVRFSDGVADFAASPPRSPPATLS